MKHFLDEGTGLFGTHVSLEDVNCAISEQMNTEAQLEEDTEFTVIGDGNGYSSRVFLMSPKWTTSDHPLPDRFVLKIISCEHMKSLVESSKASHGPQLSEEEKRRKAAHFETTAKKLHNQEVNFYRIVQKLGIASKILSPEVYFSKTFDSDNELKGFVGMEYLEGTVKHVNENVEPKSLYPVLRAIAALQAKSSLLTGEERKMIGTTMFQETMRPMLEHGMKGIFEFLKRMDGGKLEECVCRVENLGKELVDFDSVFNLNKCIGIHEDVLCHGDLWGANILWNSDNVPERIVDFQIVHLGNPVEDLVRLFVSMLSGVDRRAHSTSLLELFYGFYVEELGEMEPAYTLEELKESYRLYFVVGALTLLPMFGPVVQGVLRSMPKEKQTEYQNVITENVRSLLEDIETYHQMTLTS